MWSEGEASVSFRHWIGLCSVLRPRQHSIGYMGDNWSCYEVAYQQMLLAKVSER